VTAEDDVAQRFEQEYGHPADGVWAAPGRVNLIGEHVDYNDGLVLPFALTARTYAAASARDDGVVRARLVQADGALEEAITALSPGSLQEWPAYVAGVLWVLREAGHRVPGMELLLDGRVPVGAGLSSSAALECSVALAANDLADLGLGAPDLAKVAQHAENDFVGMPCGLMDQMASMVCTSGHALLYDVREETAEQVTFDPASAGAVLLVIDTKVKHELGESAYADRRRTCEEAARTLGVRSLRDIEPADLEAALAQLSDAAAARVRHVVGEIARVRRAVAALRAGDWAGLGQEMTASHASLRDDYEVSCAELDVAVEAALRAGAIGARMTGGGFGGSAIALVPRTAVDDVTATVQAAFAEQGFTAPDVSPAEPGSGAARVR
jgi:galactokinase